MPEPRGLKPESFHTTYAALKRRSSTVAQALTTFSAGFEAVPLHETLGKPLPVGFA